jgi:hypothetical protein
MNIISKNQCEIIDLHKNNVENCCDINKFKDLILSKIEINDMEILQIAFKNNGILFGGAIRDYFFSNKINDFDFIFPNEDNILCFHQDIEKYFSKKNIHYEFYTGYKYNWNSIFGNVISNTYKYVKNFDTITKKGFDFFIASNLDFDCNLFTLMNSFCEFTKYEIGYLIENKKINGYELSLKSALNNIYNYQTYALNKNVYIKCQPLTHDSFEEEEERVNKIKKLNLKIIDIFNE